MGLGYIVPIATLVKWFPDKRGMITGLAVSGFGAGALVMAPVANLLISRIGVGPTFEVLGFAYFIIVFLCAFRMQNPPTTSAAGRSETAAVATGAPEFSFRQALRTWQWYALWLTLFLNTSAGIAISSHAAPMAQEMANVTAATAAAWSD